MASLSILGIRKSAPIIISNIPNPITNNPGFIKGRVLSRRERTSGLAGLSPVTFKSPNQKKIRKIANLEKGR